MTNVVLDYSLLCPNKEVYSEDVSKGLKLLDLLITVLEKAVRDEIQIYIDLPFIGNFCNVFPFDQSGKNPKIQAEITRFMKLVNDVTCKFNKFKYKHSGEFLLEYSNINIDNDIVDEINIIGMQKDLKDIWCNDYISHYITPHDANKKLTVTYNDVKRVAGCICDVPVKVESLLSIRSFTHNDKHDRQRQVTILKNIFKCDEEDVLFKNRDLGLFIKKNKFASPLLPDIEYCCEFVSSAISINDLEPLYFLGGKGSDISYVLFRNNGGATNDYHAYSEFYLEDIPKQIEEYYTNRQTKKE